MQARMRAILRRLTQHFRRVVDAVDGRLRPALEQRAGQASGAATEVGGVAHLAVRHACEQIVKGPLAFRRKTRVLRSVPDNALAVHGPSIPAQEMRDVPAYAGKKSIGLVVVISSTSLAPKSNIST